MMDSQPEVIQPIRARAICFLLISSLIYITPIVCLILAGIHFYDDYISDWKFWNFATISCFIIYFLVHYVQIFGQAKHDKNLDEKIEFPDEENFQKTQKRLNNVKLILKTVYFILSLYGFYISFNVLDVLDAEDYRYDFFWAFFLYCTFSLTIFVLPVVVLLFGRILDFKRSLREKTGIWYKVRLFIGKEQINCPGVPLDRRHVTGGIEQDDLTDTEHFTWNGVQERIDSFQNFFKKPDFKAAREIMYQTGYYNYHLIRTVPNDYAANPDKYLTRGDIIATPFVNIAAHMAIYLGNGQVGHVSGHGEGKAAGVARIGELLGDFTTKGTEAIWIVYLPLRIRTGEEIAKKAEELATSKFRDGDYNLLFRNCQHFVFLILYGCYVSIALIIYADDYNNPREEFFIKSGMISAFFMSF
ncbi:unnamed protein product [Caenorhabditis nigoni]